MLFFYLLSPLPTIIAKRYAESVEASSALIEMSIFITSGIVISAYGLPIVLAHAPMGIPVVSPHQSTLTEIFTLWFYFIAY